MAKFKAIARVKTGTVVTGYDIENEKGQRLRISRDYMCYLVARDLIEGVTGALYNDTVVLKGNLNKLPVIFRKEESENQNTVKALVKDGRTIVGAHYEGKDQLIPRDVLEQDALSGKLTNLDAQRYKGKVLFKGARNIPIEQLKHEDSGDNAKTNVEDTVLAKLKQLFTDVSSKLDGFTLINDTEVSLNKDAITDKNDITYLRNMRVFNEEVSYKDFLNEEYYKIKVGGSFRSDSGNLSLSLSTSVLSNSNIEPEKNIVKVFLGKSPQMFNGFYSISDTDGIVAFIKEKLAINEVENKARDLRRGDKELTGDDLKFLITQKFEKLMGSLKAKYVSSYDIVNAVGGSSGARKYQNDDMMNGYFPDNNIDGERQLLYSNICGTITLKDELSTCILFDINESIIADTKEFGNTFFELEFCDNNSKTILEKSAYIGMQKHNVDALSFMKNFIKEASNANKNLAQYTKVNEVDEFYGEELREERELGSKMDVLSNITGPDVEVINNHSNLDEAFANTVAKRLKYVYKACQKYFEKIGDSVFIFTVKPLDSSFEHVANYISDCGNKVDHKKAANIELVGTFTRNDGFKHTLRLDVIMSKNGQTRIVCLDNALNNEIHGFINRTVFNKSDIDNSIAEYSKYVAMLN